MTMNHTTNHRLATLAIAAVLCLPCSQLFADSTAPAPAATLSPAIQEALKDFSSDDAKTRREGSAKLQLALAQQLKTLASVDDPEVVSGLDDIFQFNEGLTRWVAEILKLPEEQRKSILEFGFKPEVFPSLALIFTSEPLKRAGGIRAFAKIDDPRATAILASFLDDPDRAVYLAAMEAVWDRKPTDAVVDALWDRAVGDAASNGKAPAEIPFTFRDQPVGGPGMAGGMPSRKLDGNIAVEVLGHIKAPSVPAKIINYLQNFDKATDPGNAPDAGSEKPKIAGGITIYGVNRMYVVQPLYNPMGTSFHNVLKLAEDYNSKDTYPILYKLATEPLRNKIHGMEGNKNPYYYSNRTPAIASMAFAIGQKAEDYKLRQLTMNGPWVFFDLKDETAAMKKLRDWYAANVDKNVPDIATDGATPAPN